MRWSTAGGAFLCTLLLSVGFFVAPSGKPGTPLRCKDMLLIALLLFLFGVGAKSVYLLGLRMDSVSLLNSFAAAFPVAGAVGLVAMVFAARRYCTMGLLLSLLCMLMFQADYPLFIYYFLGGMLATWLVTSAQSRQDVVWSVIPLTVGQILIDQQAQAGPGHGHAVAVRRGPGFAGHGFRLEEQYVAVHLIELRPSRETVRLQGRQQVAAVARYNIRVVLGAEGNIAAVIAVAVHAAGDGGSDLKGATDILKTGKLKRNVAYRHRNCSSVQRYCTR